MSAARLARELLERGIDYFRAYVCENLGFTRRAGHAGRASDVAAMEFNPLNVMILVRKPNRPDRASRASRHRVFGNADDAFAQSLPKRGLVTHAEVRSIALAELDIRATSTVWDIGAGSGSVAIEAAQLAHLGTVYAIEPEPADIALDPGQRGGVSASPTCAPCSAAPRSAGDAAGARRHFRGRNRPAGRPCAERGVLPAYSGGSMAVNVATIDGLATGYQTLKKLAGEVRVWNVAVARGIEQMDRLRFEAINPTFLLVVTKRDESHD